jgi:hypothetical protein
MQEFEDQATGLGATFAPTIIGPAPSDNPSALFDNVHRPCSRRRRACIVG